MNPSDWIYHLNLRTLVQENGFLDPCARAGARRERVRHQDGGVGADHREQVAELVRHAAR